MNDVKDYLRRLLFAVFLGPTATGFWIVFALAGLNFNDFMTFLGNISQYYAGLDSDEQWTFRFSVLSSWAVLAFSFFFLNFAIRPPRFDYRFRRQGDHWVTDIVEG